MAAIGSLKADSTVDFSQQSVRLGGQSSSYFVLNSNSEEVSDATAAELSQIMGTAGAANAAVDLLTNGDHVFPIDIPSEFRFLDVYHGILGDSAAITTSPVVRAFGCKTRIGRASPQGPAPHIINSNWPDFGHQSWFPLVDQNGNHSITLSDEVVAGGKNATGITDLVQITKPKYYRLSGVDKILLFVATAAVISDGTGMILGRLTS